jgi:hypothetical protein
VQVDIEDNMAKKRWQTKAGAGWPEVVIYRRCRFPSGPFPLNKLVGFDEESLSFRDAAFIK